MPPRDPSLRLHDIAEAIDRIFECTASHSLDSFTADRKPLREAIRRHLEAS